MKEKDEYPISDQNWHQILSHLRREKKISQDAVFEDSKKDHGPYISRMEKGGQNITLKTFFYLCERYGVDIVLKKRDKK